MPQVFKMDFSKEKIDGNEPDEFYFESDHLALKGNKDYLALLKVLAILQAQRIKVLQDLDKIHALKKQALEDPEKFISTLKAGDNLGVPPHQVVAELPKIEWSQYNTSTPGGLSRPVTRRGGNQSNNNNVSGETASESEVNDKSKITVRGRAFDQSKPETFNQLWTADEQRRLEELLIEFPPEEVESRRYKKIAEALGNRTRLQVSSRVQKYFLKLAKAGLPVPGRAPKHNPENLKKGSSHYRQRLNHFFARPSTFFPSNQDLPVYMTDVESAEQPVTQNPSYSQNSNLSAIKEEPETDAEHRKKVLHRVREDKQNGTADQVFDSNYKCDNCGEDPLRGRRWYCPSCLIDLCADCAVTLLDSSSSHPPHHRLKTALENITAVTSSTAWDPDYTPLSFNHTYNYLDPNFLPE